MIKKIYASLIIVILFCVSFVFAAEELTITTYYPSPYGSYIQLQTNELSYGVPTSTPSCSNATDEGKTYYDRSNTADGHQIKVCTTRNCSGSTYCWQPVGGGTGLLFQQVVGTTNITAPHSWGDMEDMSITFNGAGSYLIMFNAANASHFREGGVRLLVDGAVKHAVMKTDVWGTLAGDHTSFQWMEANLGSGPHTFKIQWISNSSVYQRGADSPRVLTVQKVS